MFYFIPAWYHHERTWSDNSYVWYRKPGYLSFDDTQYHSKMFHSAGEESQLLILNYAPALRSILHRDGLLESKRWVLFDQIQNIPSELLRPQVNYQSLDWPEGIAFIYTPFLIMANNGSERFANIEFGESGQLLLIDYINDGALSHKLVFDDRGFVSSIIYFKDGQLDYQDYLDPYGVWQVREYIRKPEKGVLINPEAQNRFAKPFYNSMEEIVQEFLKRFMAMQKEQGTIILASDHRHNQLVLGAKGANKLVLSFYENRYDFSQESLLKDADSANLIIVNRKSMYDDLKDRVQVPIQHISPFDTRLKLGKSQRIKELIIYFLIDELCQEIMDKALKTIFDYMAENSQVLLTLVSYEKDIQKQEQITKELKDRLTKEESPYLYLKDDMPREMFGPDGEENEVIESRVTLEFLFSDLDIMKTLEYVRLILDLSDEPDLYTQIAGISSGIPQVNIKETEFVDHMKNGHLLNHLEELEEVLHYYLDGLFNWNRSLVYTVEKIAEHTSGQVVQKIKNSLESNYD